MKKITLIMLSFFLLCGCQKNDEEDKQFVLYKELKESLVAHDQFERQNDFRVAAVYNQMNNVYRYDVVIDQVQVDMYDIVAMAYADEDEDRMCPSIGIFDDESYSLKKDFVDKPNGFYKGVQLSGETDRKQSIKVYISYYPDIKRREKIEKYIEVQL